MRRHHIFFFKYSSPQDSKPVHNNLHACSHTVPVSASAVPVIRQRSRILRVGKGRRLKPVPISPRGPCAAKHKKQHPVVIWSEYIRLASSEDPTAGIIEYPSNFQYINTCSLIERARQDCTSFLHHITEIWNRKATVAEFGLFLNHRHFAGNTSKFTHGRDKLRPG
jgi:hypothetical protein